TNGVILGSTGNQLVAVHDTLTASISGSISIMVTPPLYVVTTLLDSGPGSLRQAILDADANSGPAIIRFAIGTGKATINLAFPLPAITEPVILDGTSQPGYAGT